MEFTNKRTKEATSNPATGIEIKYSVSYDGEKLIGVQGQINFGSARIGSLSAGTKYDNLNLSIDKGVSKFTESELSTVLSAVAKDIVELFKS